MLAAAAAEAGQPAIAPPVASLGGLRVSAVEHTRIYAEAAAAGRRWAAAALVRKMFLSTRISHRRCWFLMVLFKFLEIYFHFYSKIL